MTDDSKSAIKFSDVSKMVDPRYSVDNNRYKMIYGKNVFEKDHFLPTSRKQEVIEAARRDPSQKDNHAKLLAKDRFEDPYDDEYKDRLINGAIFDPVIQQPLLIRINYILGHNLTPTFRPNRNIDNLSAQEAQQVLNDIIPVLDQEKASHYIWTIENQIIPWRTKLESGLFTAFVGGRAALLKEPMIKENPWRTLDNQPFPETTPGILKILSYKHLGQVLVSPETWEIESVVYKDNIFEEDNFEYEMPRDWLIYFTHMDVGMIPYSTGYGNSIIPPIMAISENNRRINEIVFPEIDESLWAGTGHWKVKDLAIFDQQAFVDSIRPARQIVYQDTDMEYQEIHLSYDQQGLLAQREGNTVIILQQARCPSPFMNNEKITNRSTMEIVSDVWQETTLEGDRRWIRDTLHRDWYTPLLQLILGVSIFNLKMHVMLEFQKITFADIQAKATAVAQLLALPAPPIEEEEARAMLGLPEQRVAILQPVEAGINDQRVREMAQEQKRKEAELFHKANKNVDEQGKIEDIPIANYIISRRMQSVKPK